MAHDDVKQPLLPASVDAATQPNQKNAGMKRRFCRSKSTPTDLVPLEKHVFDRPQRPDSIFSKLNPSIKQVALFLVIYVGIATLCFYLVKDQIKGVKTNGVLDAVYFCIVTMTTVGYGDLVPNSVATKLLACAFVFSGMALVGLVLSKSADYLVEKQEILLVRALHKNQKIGENEILKDIETNKVKYKFLLILILLVVLIIAGTIFLCEVEKLSLVDSFYCVCSTITTLGYGDKSFSSETGRVFAIFWILTSTICLAQFFLYLAELNTERRQHSLTHWVLSRKMTCKDLEAADLDNDRAVSAAEFIVYKLKEMGKISPEDVALLMEEFEHLDVDQSGKITQSDIMLA